MGIQEIFQSGAQTIVAAFGNVAKSCTYTHFGTKVESGGSLVHPSTPIPNLGVIFDSYEVDEIDGENILSKDVKGLIPFLDLGITEPTPDDTVLRTADSRLFSVIDWDLDPADALWVIQLRTA